MPRAGGTHDITIEEHDETNRRGFMVARTKEGKRRITRRDAETIRPRVLSMGELTQSELPPERELTWFAEDWSLGIGGIDYRRDPRKLGVSAKIDTSIPGVLRLARELRTTTVDSAPSTYAPTGFAVAPSRSELDPDVYSFIGRDIYSWNTDDNNWDIEAEPQAVDVIYKNAIQFGVNVVAPCWYVGTDANETAYKYIYKEPTVANWTLSTLITSGARIKYMAKGRNSTGDEVLWGGNNITDTGINIDGAHNNSTTTIATGSDPRSAISVNDIVMVGPLGAQERMLVTATASSSLTVIRGYGDDNVTHDSGDDIWLYQPHVIRSSTNPLNAGSWTSAAAIGTDDHPITGLVFDADNDVLFITKTDGIYTYTTDGQVRNVTPLFRQFANAGNFVGSYSWNNHILMPLGEGGLVDFDYDTATLKDISLRVSARDETTLHGVVLALHGDPVNLFALVKDISAQVIYLLVTNLVEYEGNTEFRWHVLAKQTAATAITNNRIGLMVDASRNNRRRVWVGFFDTGANELPRFMPFGNLNDDSQDGFTNDTDAQAETVVWDANLPRVDKRFEEIEIESRNLGAGGREILFEYQLNQDGNWFKLGIVNTSPLYVLKFPTGTVSKLLQLRITPSMTSIGTTGPEMLSFRVKSQLRPPIAPTYFISVYLADNMLLLNGARSSKRTGDLRQLQHWNEEPAELLLYLPEEHDFV